MFKVSSIVLTVALFGCASASASAVISGDRCSATTPCSNNLCCSEYGFCGSTYAFCGPGCQSGPCDPRGVSQDFTVFDMNKPGLASVVDVDDANPLNSFDNLLATNGKQGYCQPWGSGGGDLCREEKTLAACSGYDGLYYLPYKSQAEVATKCLEEPKCKGFTWDTNLKKGKLKSRIDSVYGSNRRWNCFKKQEGVGSPLNSFDNLLATNGKQGYCQPWGSWGGDLCREEKTLPACKGYDGSYYLPYKSEAEVATKCLQEPKCKGFTWDTKRAKGKLKSGISSVYNNNRRWKCFKKLESAIMACPNYSDSRCSSDGSCACYDPRELRIIYPQIGFSCYACVMPNYTPTSILQCKNDLDCDVRNSKCEIVRADYNGPGKPLSNTETMCIPNAGAAIGKPCITSTLCASGSCVYVGGSSQKGECMPDNDGGGVHSEEE